MAYTLRTIVTDESKGWAEISGEAIKGQKGTQNGQEGILDVTCLTCVFSYSHACNSSCFTSEPDFRWNPWSPHLPGWVLLLDPHLLTRPPLVGNYEFATTGLQCSLSCVCPQDHHEGPLILMLVWIRQEIALLSLQTRGPSTGPSSTISLCRNKYCTGLMPGPV